MNVDKELIERVSKLARLKLTDDEVTKFTQDFKEILAAFRVLDEIDVSGVESSFRPIEERYVLREDKAKKSISQEESLKFTKNKENGQFVAPRTIE